MKTLALLTTLISCAISFAQPANNNCATAIPLSYTGSCNYTTYSNVGATNSGDATPTCGSAPNTDVWFSFVVPASGNLLIQSSYIQIRTAMAVYTGTCGSLTALDCGDNNGQEFNMPFIRIHDQSLAGQTIYLQYWGDVGASGLFDLCLFEPILPSNDECSNAIPLTVMNDCNFSSFSNQYATNSNVATPTCGIYVGSDVWFSVQVPSSGQLILETSDQGISDPAMSIYTGDCGNLIDYGCANGGSNQFLQARFQINDLNLAGQTIYVRVWRYNRIHGSGFGLCAYEPQSGPNQSCANAEFIAPQTSCNYQDYSNTDYLGSGEVTSSCGNFVGGEAWYKTVVPNSGNLIITSRDINVGNLVLSAYTGECGNLSEYICRDNGSSYFLMPEIFISDPSLAGDTIYFIAYKYNNNNGGDYQMCVFEPSIPSNDECSDAIPITVMNDCNFSSFTNQYATNSNVATPTCGNYVGSDVWFSVQVPSSGQLILETSDQGISDPAMSIYTGDCGNLIDYGCANGGSNLFLQARFQINDLNLAGQTIYVRIWRYNNIQGSDFGFCAYEPQSGPNQSCANAEFIAPQTFCNYQNYSNTDYLGSGEVSGTCGNYVGGEAWYKTVVPNSGNLVITSRDINIGNLVLSAYTGECGNLTEYICRDNGSPYFLMPEIIINDPSIAGDTIYFIAYKYNNNNGGDYQMCVFEPTIPENQNCSGALDITVQPDCNFTSYTNEFANASGDALPSCGIYAGADIWFKFTVPSNGEFTIDSRPGSINDIDLSVYTGVCGSLSAYACTEGGSSYSSWMPKLVVSDPALANQTIYVQVWKRNSINGGTFDLCVYSDLVPEVTGANDIAICEYESLPILNVNDGVFQINWYDAPTGGNQLASDTNQYQPTSAGTYYVDATNPSTLEVSPRTEINLTITPSPIIVGAVDVELCAYDETQPLSVNDLGENYSWIDAMTLNYLAVDTNQYLPTQNGLFGVFATDENSGCNSDTVYVNWIVHPTVLVVNPTGYEGCDDGNSHSLSVDDNGDQYNWYSDANASNVLALNSSQYEPSDNGTYYVVAFDSSTNCSSDTIALLYDLWDNATPLITFDGDFLETVSASSYQWYLNGTAITGATSQTFNLTESGSYSVQVTYTNGCSAFSEEVVIDISWLEEISLVSDFQIAPNPFTSQLIIDVSQSEIGSELLLFDQYGRLIESKEINTQINLISGLNLLPGVYFVQVKNERGSRTKKVIKI